VRVKKLRLPKLAQVSEISQLKCYNRYFWQKKYAHPVNGSASSSSGQPRIAFEIAEQALSKWRSKRDPEAGESIHTCAK
jgi:hypothetical protein